MGKTLQRVLLEKETLTMCSINKRIVNYFTKMAMDNLTQIDLYTGGGKEWIFYSQK